jgi:hypothetical protein
MSEAFIKKNTKLLGEFDQYLIDHPDLWDKIPNGAHVIITVQGDDKFNSLSVSMVRDTRRKKVVEAHKADHRWSLRPLQLQAA